MNRRNFLRLSAQAAAVAALGGLDGILRTEKAHARRLSNDITIDIDPTLGPPNAPTVDMTKWVAQGYLLDETSTEKTIGLRIFERTADGNASLGQHEIRKVITLGIGENTTIDDLATIPIIPEEGIVTKQLPEYWSGLRSNVSTMSFQPDLPHTFYFDTNGSHDAEGKTNFQQIVENFNNAVPGYESVMRGRITENTDFAGSGEWDNPTYPEGFERGNLRHSLVVFDGSAPTDGAYDPNTQVLYIGRNERDIMKEELGRALFGGGGTIYSAGTNDTTILPIDIMGLRIAFNSDVQGPNGETRRINLDDLYLPNQRDGSGIFPGDLPEEVAMAQTPLNTNGNAVYSVAEPPVPTETTSWGSLKAFFRDN